MESKLYTIYNKMFTLHCKLSLDGATALFVAGCAGVHTAVLFLYSLDGHKAI